MSRRKSTTLITIAAAAALTLTACSGGGDPLTGGGGDDSDTGSGSGGGSITVGAANFPESEIVAHLYAIALEDAGLTVDTRLQIGSREAYIPALEDGSIDLIPDYTGNLLRFLDTEATATSAEDIDAALPAALEAEGLAALTPAPAENKDAVVVTAETAEDWNLTTIGDLAAYNAETAFAANAEFAERPAGLPGLAAVYGFEPVRFVPIADGGGPATVAALKDGEVQAANIFTTTPAIESEGFVVLEDPDANFAAQNVVPVLNADEVTDEITQVLDALSAELTTEDLIALNTRVSGDEKAEPETAAREWLEEKGLIG
ncbi:ABC transporter substrate-binding protein [Litorihabitans aurantiacus]|uniref:Amino acid ABC transporter, substrate binding protein n=1 Tax=Litorihabitans aurantiacus TaxID=1930061 RepID=A0AA37XFI3_9MICO|nr:ABC transporter substrate-binding protein [Litorihabitans aurantiacus]GMA32239.1 putative amino acid ABC transporter, substrate binding protein [Litorihabitans aurantiacus]